MATQGDSYEYVNVCPGPADEYTRCEHNYEHEDCVVQCVTCAHTCSDHYPSGDKCDLEECDCKRFQNDKEPDEPGSIDE